MKLLRFKTVSVDFKPLDGTGISVGMKTTCDACGKEITDEYFLGRFKDGQVVPKLHESCAPEESR